MSTVQEKCYDPRDSTLRLTDGDDDLDFLCEDFKSLRAKMSCGHAVTPMSLTNWCRRLLDQGECRFVCGQTNCNIEWSYEEVCKMALLTKEEKEYFEQKLLSNSAKEQLDIKTCPGCRSTVVRPDPNDLCFECSACTAANKNTFRFCWQCLREWKGPAPRSDRCENSGCQSPLDILKTCPDITFKEVRGVTGCPCIRACPTCGLLLEHNRTYCKNITCPRCKVEFCFVCLKLTDECLQLLEDELSGNEFSEEDSSEEDSSEEGQHQEPPQERQEHTEEHQEPPQECQEVTEEHQEPPQEHQEPPQEHQEPPQERQELTEEHQEPPQERQELSEMFLDYSEIRHRLNVWMDSSDEEADSPHFMLCSTGVAPRQTSIPVWKKRKFCLF